MELSETADTNKSDITAIVKELSIPLYAGKGWLKFIGVFNLIFGILYGIMFIFSLTSELTFISPFIFFSLLGIIGSCIYIYWGVLLLKVGKRIKVAHLSGDKNEFVKSLLSLNTYFRILGILYLSVLVFIAIYIVIILIVNLVYANFIIS